MDQEILTAKNGPAKQECPLNKVSMITMICVIIFYLIKTFYFLL